MSETITTITIKTFNDKITDVKAMPAEVVENPVEIKPVKKKKHTSRDNYAVHDIDLLRKIIDAGLLELLHGIYIGEDKNKSWHFDKVPEVKAVMDNYYITREQK